MREEACDAAGAPSIHVINTIADFFTFWQQAKDREIPVQLQLWNKTYARKHRAIFDVYFFMGFGSRKKLPQALQQYPDLLERIRELHAGLEEDIQNLVDKVSCLLKAPRMPLNIVLMVGTFGANGWSVPLWGKPTAFLALESFQTKLDLLGTLAHELIHSVHLFEILMTPNPWLRLLIGIGRISSMVCPKLAVVVPFLMQRFSTVGQQIFVEGLAVAASKRIVTGQTESWYLWMGRPDFDADEWLEWAKGHERELFVMALKDLDKRDEATKASYITWGNIQGRQKLGYYIGYKVIEHLSKSFSFSELARVQPSAYSGMIRHALEELLSHCA